MLIPLLLANPGRPPRRRLRVAGGALRGGMAAQPARRRASPKTRAARDDDYVTTYMHPDGTTTTKTSKTMPPGMRAALTILADAKEKKMAKARRRRLPARDSKGHFKKTHNPARKRAHRVSNPPRRVRRRRNGDATGARMVSRIKRVKAAAPAAAPKKPRRRRAATAAPAAKPATRRPRRAAPRRATKQYAALNAKIRHLDAQLKHVKSRKASPTRARRYVLKMKRRDMGGRLSASQRQYMRVHGLSKVNPSFGDVGHALLGALPEIGVALVGFTGLALGSAYLGKKLVARVPASMVAVVVPATTGLLSVVGFAALRMFGLAKYSVPFLTGGLVATGVMTLGSIETGAEGSKMSLGHKLGLPIGDPLLPGISTGIELQEYVDRKALQEYVDRKALQEYVDRAALQGMDVRNRDSLNGEPETGVAGYLGEPDEDDDQLGEVMRSMAESPMAGA